MEPKSLGYRTDLIFPPMVLDRGDYLVVRTPDNPGYHWGNYLLFACPPGPDSCDIWLAAFEEEIAAKQPTEHTALAWEGSAGVVEGFLHRGLRLDRSVVLSSETPRPPPRPNEAVDVRPLVSNRDWAQALDNQIACRDPIYALRGYRRFKQDQMRRYRALAASGRGRWFGAFLGERLVADLGLYFEGELGRYQSVETHPAHRRQGICGSLVYRAGQYAQTHWGVQTLVLVADPEADAARVYESLGFQVREHTHALHAWQEQDA